MKEKHLFFLGYLIISLFLCTVYYVVLCLTFWSFVCWLLISCCAALLIFAFLVSHRGEGLSKTAIGDYLGEKSPFHEQVLKAFVDLHDFTDLIIVQALR